MIQSDKHKYADVLRPGMPRATQFFSALEGLIKVHLPRLHAHFEKEGVEAPLYAARWVVTCFTCFSFDLALRVFDAFLLEGWKIIYRVALALLRISERELLKMPFDQIVGYLQHQLQNSVEEEKLMAAAFRISISLADIDALELEAEEQRRQRKAALEERKRERRRNQNQSQ